MDSKYVSIYRDYTELIENGSIKSGEYLSSESEIMKQYGASRDTVRKALNLLEQNAYILKNKGKRSQVLDRGKYDFPISQIISYKELVTQQGIKSETKVEEFGISIGDSQIMEKLDVSEEEEVYKIVRTRKIDNEKIILDKDYIIKGRVQGLTRKICGDSIYEYIENVLGLKIGVAKKIVMVKPATKEDKKYMDIGNDDYVAVVYSYTRLEDGMLFQYTESRHRIDKFKFIEYAHR